MKQKNEKKHVQESTQALTLEKAEQEHLEGKYPWIVFGLNGMEYGVNSKYVLSIEILDEIVPVADATPSCPGKTRSRGGLVELLDLRALFGMGNYTSVKYDDQSDRHMMLVTETDNVKRGVLVDEIVSFEYITQRDSVLSGKINGTALSKYVSQVARREELDTPVLIIRPESLNTH